MSQSKQTDAESITSADSNTSYPDDYKNIANFDKLAYRMCKEMCPYDLEMSFAPDGRVEIELSGIIFKNIKHLWRWIRDVLE